MTLMIVCILVLYTDEQTTHVVALGMGHYVIAFLYSFHILKKTTLSFPRFGMVLLLISMAFYCSHEFPDSIPWIFGLHHVLSESLNSLNLRFKKINYYSKLNLLTLSRSFFHLSCYAIIIRFDELITPIIAPTNEYIPVLLITSISLHLIISYFSKNNFKKYEYYRIFAFDLITAIFVILTCLYPAMKVQLFQVIIYHVIFWIFYPLAGMIKHPDKHKVLLKYILISLTTYLIFYKLVWYEQSIKNYNLPFMFNTFITVGFYHIFCSIGLSVLNPVIISRFFGLAPKNY